MTFMEDLYKVYVRKGIISGHNLPLPKRTPMDFYYMDELGYHEEKDDFVLYKEINDKFYNSYSDMCFSKTNLLSSVLSEAKENPLFNGSFNAEVLNTRDTIDTLINNVAIVRPTPCIYTGSGVDNHWITGKGLGGKKENAKILKNFNIELREVSCEPDWHEVMFHTYCKFGDLFSASSLSSDYHRYTVYKKYSDIRDRTLFLEILKDGKMVGYVSLARPFGIHISEGSVWHYASIICYESNLARPVATFCAQYLHERFGDTLLSLTSGFETFYPTYQHYKMSIANVSMPFFSLEVLVKDEDGYLYANNNQLEFDPIEPYWLGGKIIGNSHTFVGYKMDSLPNFTRFDHTPFFKEDSGREYTRLLDFLDGQIEKQRGAK